MDRFLSKIEKISSGCWEWRGGKSRGYGQFRYHGKMVAAHRFSWQFYKGKIPKRKFVLHSCDNTGCVNPDHLFLGTQSDNMKDMFAKRRRKIYQRGEKNNQAKLSANNVLEIRRLLATGQYKQKELAVRFSVTRSTISAIMTGHRWSQ